MQYFIVAMLVVWLLALVYAFIQGINDDEIDPYYLYIIFVTGILWPVGIVIGLIVLLMWIAYRLGQRYQK